MEVLCTQKHNGLGAKVLDILPLKKAFLQDLCLVYGITGFCSF